MWDFDKSFDVASGEANNVGPGSRVSLGKPQVHSTDAPLLCCCLHLPVCYHVHKIGGCMKTK